MTKKAYNVHEWRGVLAAAYKGRQETRKLLRHLVDVETGTVLCKRIDPDRMADAPDENAEKCETCLERSVRRGIECRHD